MLDQPQLEKFQRDGFTLGWPLLTEAEVDELRAEMDRITSEEPGSGPQPVSIQNLAGDAAAPVWQIVNIWQASDAFRRLAFHPDLIDAAATLIQAKQLRIWHDQIQYKPAGTGGVNPWHQDSPLWPVLEPKDAQITAWVALDDVDEENGCMSMVPGSHQWGNHMDELREIRTFDATPTSFHGHDVKRSLCPVESGCVHFHHALTWHGSHGNRSGRPRRAIAIHYMNERTRYTAAGNHLMKPYIEVADGQPLEGDAFPLVYNAGEPARQPA
ncbi:MAG: phytanoyl-CoA dioxygenase family protein [Phycisphaeraceae bacterium]